MSMSNQTAKTSQYALNGVQDTFAFSFPIESASDLEVLVKPSTGSRVEKTLPGTDYTVTNTNNTFVNGGNVVLDADAVLANPSGILVIRRTTPRTQTVVDGDMTAENVEGGLDKLTRVVNDLQEQVLRCLIHDATDDPGAQLPDKTARAGMTFKWDENGDPVPSAGIVDPSVTVSSFMETLLDDADSDAALTTLNISAFAQTILDDADAAAARTTIGAPATSHTHTESDITDLAHTIPRGYLHGLTLSNNVTDANNDIDVAVGEATDGGYAVIMTLASAITKRLDAAWAVGTNQGGLDTGSKAADTWYHVWLIQRSDTGVVDALFSTSFSSPTMPTSYDTKRRIGAVLTDSSSNILAFTQDGDWFKWVTPTLDISATYGTTRILVAVPVPSGYRCQYRATASVYRSTSWPLVYIGDPDNTDASPTSGPHVATQRAESTSLAHVKHYLGRTDASSRVAVRAAASSTTINFSIHAWEDRRGVDG